jgi:hypothetical protein
MDGLVVVGFVVIGLMCVGQGYLARIEADAKRAQKQKARDGTVLGRKGMVVAEDVPAVANEVVDLKRVAVGMTLLELGLDPQRRDHWVTASKVVEAQLDQLDSIELMERGPLLVSDVDTDPVIELPSRDPVEISEVDGVTI